MDRNKTNRLIATALRVTSLACLVFAIILFVQMMVGGSWDDSLFRTVNIMLLLGGLVLQGLARIIHNQTIIIDKLYQDKEESHDRDSEN